MNTEEQIYGISNNEVNFFKDPLKDGYFKRQLDTIKYVKSLLDNKEISEEQANKLMEEISRRTLEAVSQTLAMNDPNFNVNNPVKIPR